MDSEAKGDFRKENRWKKISRAAGGSRNRIISWFLSSSVLQFSCHCYRYTKCGVDLAENLRINPGERSNRSSGRSSLLTRDQSRDQREDIFGDDQDRNLFLATLMQWHRRLLPGYQLSREAQSAPTTRRAPMSSLALPCVKSCAEICP